MIHQATFAVRAFGAVPLTLRFYSGEVLWLLGDICWGSGAVVVGGGIIGVMVLLALFTGTRWASRVSTPWTFWVWRR